MDAPIDQAFVSKLLLRAEQGIHKNGWDQDPWIGVLFWARPGALALHDAGIKVQNPPGAFLEWLGAQQLNDPELGRALNEVYGESFFGFAFVCEAWMQETDDPEAAERRLREGRRIADTPDAKEIRSLNAVDLYARLYMIRRVRGEKPTDISMDSGVQQSGRVVAGLANMVLGAVRHMPHFADRLLDLETLFIPNAVETMDAMRLSRGMSPPQE